MPHATSEPELPDLDRVGHLLQFLLGTFDYPTLTDWRAALGTSADAQVREDLQDTIDELRRQLDGFAGFTKADLTEALLHAPDCVPEIARGAVQ